MSPLLKRIRSWFHEVIVESWESPVNGKVDVSLVDGRYVLNSGPSNYSYGSLYRVFKKALNDEGPKLAELSPVLILGLGAGSVVHILHKEWHYDVHITGVEKDPIVIAAGKKYFGLQESEYLQIINTDALEFVDHCQGVFGIIIVDLYVGKDVPTKFEQESFIRKLSELLDKPGVMMFNKMVYDDVTRLESKQLFGFVERYFDKSRVRRLNEKWENHIIIGEKIKYA